GHQGAVPQHFRRLTDHASTWRWIPGPRQILGADANCSESRGWPALMCLRPRSRIARRDGAGWPLSDGCRLFEPDRQSPRNHRALARLARHGHVATHHARELAGDGKPEPRAAEALSGRGIALTELLEQLCLLLWSHANAGVSDRELNPVATVGDPAR